MRHRLTPTVVPPAFLGRDRTGGVIRAIATRLALFAGSLVLVILAVEAGLRLLTGADMLSAEPRLRVGTLVYEPDQVSRFKQPEWDVEVRIDARGFRDESSCGRMGPGDVVFLGDSFVEGYCVSLADSVSKRLEAHLAAGGRPCHVYNAGHCATHPRHYVRTYGTFFDRVKHETVVMGFYVGNDLVGPTEADAITPPERTALAYRLKVFLGEHSALYNLVNDRAKRSPALARWLTKLKLMEAVPALPESIVYAPDTASTALSFTCGLIRAFARSVAASGRSFLLVLIPTREQVEDARWRSLVASGAVDPRRHERFALNERLRSIFAAWGVWTLDLTAPFVRCSKSGSLYFVNDRHWTPKGHDLAAREIARTLLGTPAAGTLSASERPAARGPRGPAPRR